MRYTPRQFSNRIQILAAEKLFPQFFLFCLYLFTFCDIVLKCNKISNCALAVS